MKKGVVLSSPGLDSFIVNHLLETEGHLDHDIIKVYFDLGTMNSSFERRCLRLFHKDVIIKSHLDLSMMEKEDAYIPNRNLLMLALAQGLYNADTLFIGGVKDDRVEDNDYEFYQLASDVLSKCAGKSIGVDSLLKDKEKIEWIKLYYSYHQGNPEKRADLLVRTFSCFTPQKPNSFPSIYAFEKLAGEFVKLFPTTYPGCLECPACFRKCCALTGANIYVPFRNIKLAQEYVKKVDKNIYPNRYESIINLNEFLVF